MPDHNSQTFCKAWHGETRTVSVQRSPTGSTSPADWAATKSVHRHDLSTPEALNSNCVSEGKRLRGNVARVSSQITRVSLREVVEQSRGIAVRRCGVPVFEIRRNQLELRTLARRSSTDNWLKRMSGGEVNTPE